MLHTNGTDVISAIHTILIHTQTGFIYLIVSVLVAITDPPDIIGSATQRQIHETKYLQTKCFTIS